MYIESIYIERRNIVSGRSVQLKAASRHAIRHSVSGITQSLMVAQPLMVTQFLMVRSVSHGCPVSGITQSHMVRSVSGNIDQPHSARADMGSDDRAYGQAKRAFRRQKILKFFPERVHRRRVIAVKINRRVPYVGQLIV